MDQCLDQVRKGDQQAARALVDELYSSVLRIVRAHRPARQGEEDLMQEVFMKLFAKLDRYQARPQIPFLHWVSRLTVRTCLDALRAERRRPEWPWADLPDAEAQWLDYLVTEASQTPPAPSLDSRELVDALLSRLSPPDRLILTLTDLEDRSVAEISQLTGWSRAAVKVRTFRARQRLQRVAAQLKKEMHP